MEAYTAKDPVAQLNLDSPNYTKADPSLLENIVDKQSSKSYRPYTHDDRIDKDPSSVDIHPLRMWNSDADEHRLA